MQTHLLAVFGLIPTRKGRLHQNIGDMFSFNHGCVSISYIYY